MQSPRAVAALAIALAGALAGCAAEVLRGEGDAEADVAAATAELRVCADGATTPGIDVSHWQGTIDWDAVAGAGIRFAVIRVSDGTGTMDREFHRNWREAKRVGIVRGVYQYFRPNQDPVAQADLLLRELGALEAGDLPPVIDVEERGGRTPAQIAEAVGAWIRRVEGATGRKPMIYTARYFWQDDVGNAAEFRDYPLWIANWGVTCPDLPSAWSDWDFWQTSATGRVAGITGDVDLDVFNGDLAALRAWIEPGCAPSCDGDVLVGAGCGRVDCGASGARCVDDAGGPRCVLDRCPATGEADVCVSETVIGHCRDGVLTSMDCGGYAGICSTAGRAPTAARCVSAFCVSDAAEVPVAHDGCWPSGGRLMRCDASGLPAIEDCPVGTACSVASGTARCEAPVCPASGAGVVCIDGRYRGSCEGGAVVAAVDCGEGLCDEAGGAHCVEDGPPAGACARGRCGEGGLGGGCSAAAGAGREPRRGAAWSLGVLLWLARRRLARP